VVHAAVEVELATDEVVAAASVALGSVAPTVVSAPDAERHLVGRRLDADAIGTAARLAAEGVTPIDDVRATATYRSEEVAVVVARALAALAGGRERERWPAAPVFLWGPDGRVAPAAGGTGSVAHEPDSPVRCTINGVEVSAPRAAGSTLLDWLRDEVGLTGTKEGCAEGECGACTVHLDGVAVLSCLVPAPRAHGAELRTIEGLAPREDGTDLHPLQAAFIDQFAVQCGFCIPGFLMSGDRLLAECPRPTREQIAFGLAGNLCRCTGYYRFYQAVEQAAGGAR
jgi:carbon-monoxide dehydrogenase medium subunit